jgi:hypothetical protein
MGGGPRERLTVDKRARQLDLTIKKRVRNKGMRKSARKRVQAFKHSKIVTRRCGRNVEVKNEGKGSEVDGAARSLQKQLVESPGWVLADENEWGWSEMRRDVRNWVQEGWNRVRVSKNR